MSRIKLLYAFGVDRILDESLLPRPALWSDQVSVRLRRRSHPRLASVIVASAIKIEKCLYAFGVDRILDAASVRETTASGVMCLYAFGVDRILDPNMSEKKLDEMCLYAFGVDRILDTQQLIYDDPDSVSVRLRRRSHPRRV